MNDKSSHAYKTVRSTDMDLLEAVFQISAHCCDLINEDLVSY